MGLFGPNVEKLKAKRDINGLIKALDYHKDSSVRIKAAQALGQLGDTRAITSLAHLMRYSNNELRKEVILALKNLNWEPGLDKQGAIYWIEIGQWNQVVQIGAPAVGPLIQALYNRSKRDDAGRTLQKLGSPAIPPLIEMIESKDQEKCQIASRVLAQIGLPAVDPLIKTLNYFDPDVQKATIAALSSIGLPAIEKLIVALRGDYSQRKFIEDALVQIGKPAVLPLIAGLQENNYDSDVCARILGEIGDPEAVEPMILMLANGKYGVKARSAAYGLGKIADIRALKPLISALKHERWEIRCSAAFALGHFNDPSAVDALLGAIGDVHQDVIRAAIESLGRIADPKALDTLISLLDSEKLRTRKKTAEALVMLYESGRLKDTERQTILKYKIRIMQKHTDHNTGSSDCISNKHTDSGIGINFPV